VRWFESCDGWRLATEAEWEYGVRGGTETAYWCGAEVSCLDSVEWHSSNRPGNNPHFVGILPANTRGLHDMAGNVAEWVFDHYHRSYGETVAPSDPVFREGSAAADVVLRGGSANDLAVHARSAGRRAIPPTFRDFATGFRPVRTIDP
jgi:formylglycine-generating enzyme required for sulfatase activity